MPDFQYSPVFSKLSDTDRKELIQLAVKKIYQKGEIICWQGDTWSNVLYLLSGKVVWAMLSVEGKRQVAFHLQGGDIILGLSLIDGKPMPATLEVIEECEAYVWSKENFVPVVSRSVEAVWDVSHLLAGAMRRVREVVYGFAFHSVAGRLARLLLDYYQPNEGEPRSRELTLEEMAAAVGTTRELVCKVLYQFADEGMIRIKRTEFIFTDPERLETVAGEG